MNFRDYLTVARERWLILLLGIGLGFGVGGSVAFLGTPQYVATVKFVISAPDGSRDLNQAYEGSLLSQQKIKSYVDLASDRRIRDEVSRDLGAPIDPGVISAAAKPDTVLMTLSARDAVAVRALQIVNLAAKAFGELVAEVERPTSGAQLVVAREVQGAQLPTDPVSPRRKTDVALGLLFGFMGGMGLAVVRHTLDRTVKSPDTLSELVGAPVLGATQYDQAVKATPLIVHDHPRAPLAEAFRQLRTNLDYVDLDHAHKLIVITSALPNEGKTITACNLAIAMAQAGNKVAIVEADLRRPRAAEYLGMENAVGLTTVLIGQVPLSAALQPWRGGLLDFLGAGQLPPNPSELLASSKMGGVLAELQARYDMVIFDAAPTLPVADAAVLAAQCHGVLFVGRHGWARADQIRAAAETIRRVATPIYGVVLSAARGKTGGGYGYQYGYSYSQKKPAARSSASRAAARRPAAALPMGPPPLAASSAVPSAAVPSVAPSPGLSYSGSGYAGSVYTPPASGASVPAPRTTNGYGERSSWETGWASGDDLGWSKPGGQR